QLSNGKPELSVKELKETGLIFRARIFFHAIGAARPDGDLIAVFPGDLAYRLDSRPKNISRAQPITELRRLHGIIHALIERMRRWPLGLLRWMRKDLNVALADVTVPPSTLAKQTAGPKNTRLAPSIPKIGLMRFSLLIFELTAPIFPERWVSSVHESGCN